MILIEVELMNKISFYFFLRFHSNIDNSSHHFIPPKYHANRPNRDDTLNDVW